MKLRPSKKYASIGITIFLVIAASILFFLTLYNINYFFNIVKLSIRIISPVILGFSITLILNPVLNFFEFKVFKNFGRNKKNSNLPRIISIICSLLSLIIVISTTLIFIIPELVSTTTKLFEELPSYISNFRDWLSKILSSNEFLKNIFGEDVDVLIKDITSYLQTLLPQFNKIIYNITNGAIGLVVSILNIIIGIIISIYIMLDKNKFKAQSKKIILAIFPKDFCKIFLKIASEAYNKFSKFISSKLIDSLIIGIICFIGMTIFKMPYALIVSAIICITNIIPFFGPFIGAIPSIFLILLVNPISAIWFVIFIILLQQFDGNILSPKIIGDSTGLSPFWVLFSILLGGGLFGIIGMIIAIPTFAIIYSIIKSVIEKLLKKKSLPTQTDDYYEDNFSNILN